MLVPPGLQVPDHASARHAPRGGTQASSHAPLFPPCSWQKYNPLGSLSTHYGTLLGLELSGTPERNT